MTALTSFDTYRQALEIDKQTIADAQGLHETARAALRDLPGWKRDFLSGDLVRVAGAVKETLQGLQPKAKTILLFYLGPASGAVFIGHRLNAVAASIHLHEMRDGVYIPSFVLG